MKVTENHGAVKEMPLEHTMTINDQSKKSKNRFIEAIVKHHKFESECDSEVHSFCVFCNVNLDLEEHKENCIYLEAKKVLKRRRKF